MYKTVTLFYSLLYYFVWKFYFDESLNDISDNSSLMNTYLGRVRKVYRYESGNQEL